MSKAYNAEGDRDRGQGVNRKYNRLASGNKTEWLKNDSDTSSVATPTPRMPESKPGTLSMEARQLIDCAIFLEEFHGKPQYRPPLPGGVLPRELESRIQFLRDYYAHDLTQPHPKSSILKHADEILYQVMRLQNSAIRDNGEDPLGRHSHTVQSIYDAHMVDQLVGLLDAIPYPPSAQELHAGKIRRPSSSFTEMLASPKSFDQLWDR